MLYIANQINILLHNSKNYPDEGKDHTERIKFSKDDTYNDVISDTNIIQYIVLSLTFSRKGLLYQRLELYVKLADKYML